MKLYVGLLTATTALALVGPVRADDSDKIVWVMYISQRGGDAVVT